MTQRFVWYELMTPDPQVSRKFYEGVIGWRVDEQPTGEMDYRMIASSEGLTGGMLTINADMKADGARPGWVGYIGVDDVDQCILDVKAAGGAVHLPAFDMEGVGRLAMIADPFGAVFYILRGQSDQPSQAFSPHSLGHCGWNELHASDGAAALDFYTKHFGWSEAGLWIWAQWVPITSLRPAMESIRAA